MQKVPIYLGAPILSSLPGVGRVVCEWRLQERARALPIVCRLVPEGGKTKTVRGDMERQRSGILKEKLKSFQEKPFSEG